MKRTLLLAICLFSLQTVVAQRFGFIETDKILSKMPEYKEAQAELDQYAKNWEQKLKKMRSELRKMESDYHAEELMLTPEMKKTRQDSIEVVAQNIDSYQERVFGYEGELFQKRKALVRPIQDKVYEAVEKVSRAKRLDFMFDKSADLVMLYAKQVHNYTDFVLEELDLGDPVDTIKGRD